MSTTQHFHSGYNMPGYLPEADVGTFTSWADAKRSMIDYLDKEGDFYFDDGGPEGKDLADELSAEMEDLNLDSGPEWSSPRLGNIAYWIKACSDDECELLADLDES